MRRARWLVLGLLAGCGRDTPPPAAAAKPRLYSDPELASYSATLRQRLDDNAHRECGPSDRELIALIEPGSAMAPCIDQIGAAVTSGDLGEQLAHGDRALVDLDRQCGAQLEQAIAAASAGPHGCSPYQVGVRVLNDPLRVRRIAQLVRVRARRLATAGDPRAALLQLARAAAVFRQLARGHVTLALDAIAIDAEGSLIDDAWEISRAGMASASLDDVAAAFDPVRSAWSPFAETLEGERDASELYLALAPIEPPAWPPPGGWDQQGFGPRSAPHPLRYTRDPRDEAAVMFAFLEAQANEHLRACPPDAPLAACRRALAVLSEFRTQRANGLTEDPRELVDELARRGASVADPAALAELRSQLRTKVTDTLVAAESPNMAAFAARRARAIAALAALRLNLEVLRFIATTHRCPTVIELDAPPFHAIVAPPALGDQLAIVRRGATIVISPPAWVSTRYERTAAPWEIACPR